ncbi:MAG: 2,3-bisphosphoglycerate-independent phosphoglycerate mutase [Planctomycetota bacterium]
MFDLIQDLRTASQSKIVMMVADGLGGLPMQPGGRTELETAATPNLDRIAATAVQGASIPVKPGIAPGSGPGHLGLFGYDPLEFKIGRGALEATGIGFQLQDGDVAIRCNFCTLDADGTISDRRAGRIPTSESAPVAESLRAISIPGIEIFVEPVKEHRFVVVFRGEGLGGEVDDTDPQAVGVPPLDPVARDSASEKTAQVAKEFLRQARDILKDQPKANFHTMRGFAAKPALPTFQDVYGLRAAAIAVYPMYKGLASLVGMDVIGNAASLQEEVEVLKNAWNDYDFFFLHFKYTDSTGEDGNFDAKVEMTEQFDSVFPAVQALGPDVLIVTGDHSTPAYLKSHSWHPVPTMLWSECCRPDPHTAFNESTCITGGLGHFEAKYLMPLAMANAGRLGKYGA